MEIVRSGRVIDMEQIVRLTRRFGRVCIASEVDYLTHWWELRDAEGSFLYVGTRQSFDQHMKRARPLV
jgi:hypothetical protein